MNVDKAIKKLLGDLAPKYMTPEEAIALQEKFNRCFPSIAKYQQEITDDIQQRTNNRNTKASRRRNGIQK